MKTIRDPAERRPAACLRRGVPRPGASALHLAVMNAHFELAASAGRGRRSERGGPWLHRLCIRLPSVRKPGVGDNDPAPGAPAR